MLLLLMRHGIAESLAAAPGSDAARPLSPWGHERTLQAARGLATLVSPPALLVSSPKLRAQHTAQHLQAAFGATVSLVLWDELLLESDFAPLAAKLRASRTQSVLLVGHEPNLSRLSAWLLTGSEVGLNFHFKKAGVCALELQWSAPSALRADATLLWMLTPRTLRRLATTR